MVCVCVSYEEAGKLLRLKEGRCLRMCEGGRSPGAHTGRNTRKHSCVVLFSFSFPILFFEACAVTKPKHHNSAAMDVPPPPLPTTYTGCGRDGP